MSPALAAALLAEQFGTPTPEWHPGASTRCATGQATDRDEEDE